MIKIGFTGPRYLTASERDQVLALLPKIGPGVRVCVGDAKGLDALVRDHYCGNPVTVYQVQGRERWQYAARSQRMVKESTELIAYPNKPCPKDCTPAKPFSGHGSGTWGTIAYAVKQGLKVTICSLDDSLPPIWAQTLGQLRLI